MHKIAHPVNYLARKKWTLKLLQISNLNLNFEKLTKSKEKTHHGTPRIGNTSVLAWNLSISKFAAQYQHTPVHGILYYGLVDESCPPSYFFPYFGKKQNKNIKQNKQTNKQTNKTPSNKLFLFTSMLIFDVKSVLNLYLFCCYAQ